MPSRSGTEQSERTLPCHFIDGSAAASASWTICAYRDRLKSKTPRRHRGGEQLQGGELPVDADKRETGEPMIASMHRSLAVLYRELYRTLRGHRRTIAIALLGLSAATLLKLVPPAATKVVIDYVLLRAPFPRRWKHGAPCRSQIRPGCVCRSWWPWWRRSRSWAPC